MRINTNKTLCSGWTEGLLDPQFIIHIIGEVRKEIPWERENRGRRMGTVRLFGPPGNHEVGFKKGVY